MPVNQYQSLRNRTMSCLRSVIIILSLFVFLPSRAVENTLRPHAVITQMWAYENVVTDSVILDYKQNNIRFYFACKEQQASQTVFYQYRLFGVNDKWSSPTKDQWAFFVDLVPGNYLFQLRCRYDNGAWGEITSHSFMIDRPWWITWWAYLIYILIIGGTVIYILYLIQIKVRLHNQLKLEREIIQFRTQYVIQTSRELRTPLTLIRSTIEKHKGTSDDRLTRTDIKHLRSSIQMLMQMVENLVEFREMDKEIPCADINDVVEMADIPINQHTVLVVERNKYLADLIRRDILRFLKVEVVSDARKLVDKMCDIKPVAVVLDTDLGETNAYDLLHDIKRNIHLASIPIILISDFDTNRSIIRAIRSEADDYLQKPFNSEVLTVMILKIIKTSKYSVAEKAEKPEEIVHTEKNGESIIFEKRSDKLFLELLDSHIRANISKPDFDVNMLASVLKISRGQLYKKIKILRGVSPVDYLRDFRLSIAATLIKQNQLTVQQIMFRVGMPDATNFHRRFKEKYGMNPSAYRDL